MESESSAGEMYPLADNTDNLLPPNMTISMGIYHGWS